MRKLLDRGDAWLRRALLMPAGGAALAALGALTLLAYAALLFARGLPLLEGASPAACVPSLLCLCAPLAAGLFFLLRAASSRRAGLLAAAAACGACALAMAMRASFLDQVSSDYDLYLSGWIERLGAQPFAQSMSEGGVGEYNVLYQYILFLIARLPVPPLYAVKAVSFLGDALLAGAMARLCARDGRQGFAAPLAALLLPSAALNGAMFAQCDSLYTACALWALAWSLEGKGARGAACFALSLAFKLQAAFIMPVVVVLWAGERLRLRDALAFALTLCLVALPALLGGMPPARLAGIYAEQTGLYAGLTYNAPGLFGLMNTQGLNVYAYGYFGMALAVGACALLAGAVLPRAREMGAREYVVLALLVTLCAVFFLPRMHERYYYLPLMLALAAAAGDGRFIPCAALMELAVLGTLLDIGLALHACALLMLAALVLALRFARGR